MITDEQIKEASTLWADDYDRSSDREIAELSHYEGAQWAISLHPEWVTPDYDDDEPELPLDCEQVICLMTTGDYQVLQLLKYGINIVSWEWETVGLRPNKSFVIDDVVKWMFIPQPPTK